MRLIGACLALPTVGGHRRWGAHDTGGAADRGGGTHAGQLLAVPKPPAAALIPFFTAAKQPGLFSAIFQAEGFFQNSPA